MVIDFKALTLWGVEMGLPETGNEVPGGQQLSEL